PAELEAAIATHIGAERTRVVDARLLAEKVFGDHLPANVVLLGAAFQLGGMPLSASDIERALAGRGRAAADNRLAFDWGRWLVHDPEAVGTVLRGRNAASTARGHEPTAAATSVAELLVARRELPVELHDLLVRRTAQVIDYQSRTLAGRYLDLVEQTAVQDDSGRQWELTRTVADNWFTVLTYKDEYEVARLHVATDYDAVAAELGIDGAYALTYHLHPPFLRRLGMRKKLPAGAMYAVGFRALRRMKRLRGTAFDPFGWDRDRRAERAIIVEYADLIIELTDPVSRVGYDEQVWLANSVSEIRGYGPIKERGIARWREKVALWRRESRTRSTVTDTVGAPEVTS
ncbi:MAG: DUF6537 domain-containing protein, partial [Stackebrandtia sp.]